jgi:hypothetical protein
MKRRAAGQHPRWLLSVIAVCDRCGDMIQCGPVRDDSRACECTSAGPAQHAPPGGAGPVVSTIITRYLARKTPGPAAPPAPGADRQP